MIKFIIETDIKKCGKLWNEFSVKDEIFDLWEFREPFFFHQKITPYFIVAKEGESILGVLPLAKHEKKTGQAQFTFIGDHFIENNKFLVKEKKIISLLLEQTTKQTELSCISPDYKDYVNKVVDVTSPKFYLDINDLKSFEDYLQIFNKKHRKNLKNDLKQLERLNYKLHHNKIQDFDYLVLYNIKRFGNDSDFQENDWIELNRDLINLANRKGYLEMISVEINGKIEAVEIAFFYNGIYTLINGGSNPAINNLGKLLIAEHIKNAINKKAKIIDFLAYDSGWKRLWNSQEQTLYYFEK